MSDRFEEETFFRFCVGAIDGRHMTIQNPIKAGSTYFNYKGTFSIVLMAVCDSNYCFLYANIGAQGRISDGGVFNSSSLAQKMDSGTINLPPPEPLAAGRICVPYVIVADNAFALRENMLVPYPGAVSQGLGSFQRIFNYRLSSARSRIKNTFRIMASVFRLFRKPMLLEPKKARTVVECAVVLHNFLRRSRTSVESYTPARTFDSYTEVNGVLKLTPGSWRADNEGMTSFTPLVNIGRRSGMRPKEI